MYFFTAYLINIAFGLVSFLCRLRAAVNKIYPGWITIYDLLPRILWNWLYRAYNVLFRVDLVVNIFNEIRCPAEYIGAWIWMRITYLKTFKYFVTHVHAPTMATGLFWLILFSLVLDIEMPGCAKLLELYMLFQNHLKETNDWLRFG